MKPRFATWNRAPAFLALLVAAASARLNAQENPYDVLGKTLQPIARVFTPDAAGQFSPHALVLDAHLVSTTALPPALQGQAVHIALLTPDKLLAQGSFSGTTLMLCRDGDSLWATPGSAVQALLDQASPAATPKKKKHKVEDEVLAPMEIRVSQKELVFLPVLFQVDDAGTEPLAGHQCRVLDVQLTQQLSKSLHADDWAARVWITPDYSIAQITITTPAWTGTLAIDKLGYPATLPDTTFQPQGPDVLRLTARQFLDLMSKIGRQ